MDWGLDEVSIEGWNELEDEYAYIYANPEKDSNWKKVIVKCLVMNGKLLIDALTDRNSEPLHLEIEYALPHLCVLANWYFFVFDIECRFFSFLFLLILALKKSSIRTGEVTIQRSTEIWIN